MIISRRVCCFMLSRIVPTSALGVGRDSGHVISVSDWSISLR